MKYSVLFATLLALALLVAACGGAPIPSLPTEAGPLATSIAGTAEAALATASPMIGEALATVSPAVGDAIGTLASPAVVNTQPAGTTVSTAEIPITGGIGIEEQVTDTHGSILVDDQDRPLYIYTNDTQNGGTSACSDAECIAEWPPVLTDGMPVAGTGISQDMLGTVTREDGTVQATYNGWPLYYSASGSSNEHGEEGTWFLVTTAGAAVAP